MREDWFRWDGPLMGILEKTGQLIVLSVLWLVGSLPVITLGTSTAALYYGVMKGLRRERGSPWREFLRCYRMTLGRGIAASLLGLIPGVLLAMNIRILTAEEGRSVLLTLNVVGLILLLAATVYIGPVLSRFTMKAVKAWQLCFVMSLRFALDTVWMLGGTVLLALVQLYVFPMATVLLLPGAWSFVITFRMEGCLRKYMPPRKGNENTWYYE